MVPAANGGADRLGVAEAHPGDGLDGLGVVLAAGEHQIAACSQGGGVLEQAGIVLFHRLKVAGQLGGEGLELRMAHERGDLGQLGRMAWHGLGLLVVDHLQAVLQLAQVEIGRRQILDHAAIHMAGRRQGVQRRKSARDPHLGLAAAPDQLLGLDEELDLADAAAPQLDVVAGHRDGAPALVGVDLALDGMDVLDGGEIQRLAPDERAEEPEEGGTGLGIAGHQPRLDHGGAFPVLPEALVIGLGRHQRHGGRGRAGVGPQPEIGAEDVAVGGALVENPHQILGQGDDAFLNALAPAIDHLFVVVEHDQIDIAGIVQLAPAQLAHAEHDQAGAALGVLGMGQPQGAALGLAAQQEADGETDGGFRQQRQRTGHLLQRPGPSQVGHGRQQGTAALDRAQAGHQTAEIGFLGQFGPQIVHQPVEGGIGAAVQHPPQQSRFLLQAMGEEGAVAEHAAQQSADHRLLGSRPHEGGQIGIIGPVGGLKPARQADRGAIAVGDNREETVVEWKTHLVRPLALWLLAHC